MSQIMPYLFEGNRVRVALDENGNPWFVAKDVALALGYEWNGSSRIAHIPEEWRGITSVVTPSGTQEMLTLSEQGLYFFLGRSDKTAALPFQKWLAGDVLPSLRKNGCYKMPGGKKNIGENDDISLSGMNNEELEQIMRRMSPKMRDKALCYAVQMAKGRYGADVKRYFLEFCYYISGPEFTPLHDDSPLEKAESWAREYLEEARRSSGIQCIKLYTAYLEWAERENVPSITLTAFGKMMRRNFPVHISNKIYYLVRWRSPLFAA